LDHRGTEFFGGGFDFARTDSYGFRQAVVFHDAGVGDGYIGCALLKAGLGVAAGLKERINEVVGFSDGGFGMIDEAGLNGLPLGDKARPLGGAEVADFQSFHAGFPVGQFGFGFVRGAVRENGAVVLGAETIAEAAGAGFAVFKIQTEGDGNDEEEYNHGNGDLGIRELKLHGDLLCGNVRDGKGLLLVEASRLGRSIYATIMSGLARECWPELLTPKGL
jgi:hypothetical protein